MYWTKEKRILYGNVISALLFGIDGFALGLYATVNSNEKQNQPAIYGQRFLVSLSTQVVPCYNSTTLQLYQEVPLYSTVAAPNSSYNTVSYVIANYIIYAFTTAEGYPIMGITISVVYPDGSSIQAQGTVIRDITISTSCDILTNDLISTNIAIVGGTGRFVSAAGNWSSNQNSATTTVVTVEFAVPSYNI